MGNVLGKVLSIGDVNYITLVMGVLSNDIDARCCHSYTTSSNA